MKAEQIVACDTSLKCSVEYLLTYYYTTDLSECADEINNNSGFEITSNEQLDSSTQKFYVGDTRTCYTNYKCDGVVFTSSFNKHHLDAVAAYIGCSVLLCISCCFICCALQVCRISKREKAFLRLSRLNSIKIYDKYIFCINNMLRKSYEDEYDEFYDLEYIDILPMDIKQLICQFVEMRDTQKQKKRRIVIFRQTKQNEEISLLRTNGNENENECGNTTVEVEDHIIIE